LRKSVRFVTVNQTALLGRWFYGFWALMTTAQYTEDLEIDAGPAAQGVRESRVIDRYGKAGEAGWSPIPDVLLFNQHRLSLDSDELVVLLNLMAHYYVKNEMPFVRPTAIAKRMGVSQRSVQRIIQRLRAKGLVLKGSRHQTTGHFTHDLSPVIERLQPLGEERMNFREYIRSRSLAQQDRAPVSIG
jgi:hypothetical protein